VPHPPQNVGKSGLDAPIPVNDSTHFASAFEQKMLDPESIAGPDPTPIVDFGQPISTSDHPPPPPPDRTNESGPPAF
jgi:hypothetical protein